MTIDRQKLFDGTHDREAQENGIVRVLTREERDASRYGLLERLEPGADLWVFGYGSLLWNTEFHYVESRLGVVHGYRRSFCMWSPYSRGTPKEPGLMLALEQGGCCTGMAFRIAAEKVEEETAVLWAREMYSGIYAPRWVRMRCNSGPLAAVTFVADRSCRFYAGALAEEEQARVLATAVGQTGPNVEYLRFLSKSLGDFGLNDRRMARLHAMVEQFIPAAD